MTGIKQQEQYRFVLSFMLEMILLQTKNTEKEIVYDQANHAPREKNKTE